jgi:hypothetical protein
VLQQRCSSAALVLQQCCSVLQQCCFSVAVVLQQCCSSVAAALQQGVLPRRSGLPRGSMHLSRARASSHAHPHLPHAGPTPIPCPCALHAFSSLSMRPIRRRSMRARRHVRHLHCGGSSWQQGRGLLQGLGILGIPAKRATARERTMEQEKTRCRAALFSAARATSGRVEGACHRTTPPCCRAAGRGFARRHPALPAG